MISNHILKHIQEAAKTHDLPYDLLYGIVCQESSGRPSAIRFEPGFLRRYILKIPGLGTPEREGRATSWGLMQVMGQVAREGGFVGEFVKLLQPAVGLHWGCRHLLMLKRRHLATHGWAGVVAAYNAGSPRKRGDAWVNQYYVDQVEKYRRGAKWPA